MKQNTPLHKRKIRISETSPTNKNEQLYNIVSNSNDIINSIRNIDQAELEDLDYILMSQTLQLEELKTLKEEVVFSFFEEFIDCYGYDFEEEEEQNNFGEISLVDGFDRIIQSLNKVLIAAKIKFGQQVDVQTDFDVQTNLDSAISDAIIVTLNYESYLDAQNINDYQDEDEDEDTHPQPSQIDEQIIEDKVNLTLTSDDYLKSVLEAAIAEECYNNNNTDFISSFLDFLLAETYATIESKNFESALEKCKHHQDDNIRNSVNQDAYYAQQERLRNQHKQKEQKTMQEVKQQDDNFNCAICQCNIDNIDDDTVKLVCFHSFHMECLEQLILQGLKNCPCCRTNLKIKNAK